MKLTKAQTELLREIADFEGGVTVSEDYAPAKKLASLDLATMIHSSFGACTLRITPAGRQALATSKGGER